MAVDIQVCGLRVHYCHLAVGCFANFAIIQYNWTKPRFNYMYTFVRSWRLRHSRLTVSTILPRS